MKLLLFATIIFTHGYMCSFTPANAKSCKNWISESEFLKSQENKPAKAGCKKDEKCFCYDGIDLRDAEIKMVTEDILSKPIYDIKEPKTRQVDGLGPMSEMEKYCDEGYDLHEDKCRKIVAYEQSEPVEKLVESDLKREARLQKEADEKASQEAKKRNKEKLSEIIEVIADEIGRDDQGKFLTKEEIRLRAKELKKQSKQK